MSKDADPDSSVDFAPASPRDGRKEGEWKSRYTEPRAKWGIRIEATYLVSMLLASFIALYCNWAGIFDAMAPVAHSQEIAVSKSNSLSLAIYTVSGGLLGGTLFSLKWLYHSVAKFIWNEDRRLWRLLTPFIGAGMAFGFFALIRADIFSFLDSESMTHSYSVFGLAFIVGYFSDMASAKLAEIAETIFGTARRNN